MFRSDKQPAATNPQESTPEGKTPHESGEATPPAAGQKRHGRKDADFTPKTVFGDVAL